MIEPIPAALLPFFHETNFVSRIEVERHSTMDEFQTMNGVRQTIERDVHFTFEMLILLHYDSLGQPGRDEAMLSAFCHAWVAGHRTVAATVGSQPYRLTAVRGDKGIQSPRISSLTITGHAYIGDYAASDAARIAIASLPPPPVRVGPRSIVSLKQRGLEL